MIPYRSNKYLAFIRSLPCCACGKRWGVEAAHTRGPHGTKQKTSDKTCVPLCHTHHQMLHQGGQMDFEALYSINLREIAERLSARPFLHWEGSVWVGELQGESYVLVPDLVEAVRKMGALRRETLEESLRRTA